MMAGTLAEAARMMHGALVGDDAPFAGVSTDTRTLRAGELFVALNGPNFDGRDFVPTAVEKQAAGAVVDGPVDSPLPNVTVSDTRVALGRLASAWRQKMPARVVGLTGSNGKTTLKEMLASCLGLAGRTLATKGNLNNDIGVPLMLLRLDPEHDYAVFEMGANHAGEIAYLRDLVVPSVVAITNAAAAHLEGFGSIADVANAKGEILGGTPTPDFAVLNADDHYFGLWRSLASGSSILSFAVDSEADVRASDIATKATGMEFVLTLPDASIDISLQLVGTHNVLNAAAAAAIATVLGIASDTIREGLNAVQPVEGRLRSVASPIGVNLYDDSYNANPASVVAAARFLAAQPGESWLVLGDMAELGNDAPELHAAVGEAARDAGVDYLWAVGELSRNTVEGFGKGAMWFRSVESLIAELTPALKARPQSNVLVKGSRSMQMERVVAALAEPLGEQG